MRINTYRVQLVREQGVNYKAEQVYTPEGVYQLLNRMFNAQDRVEEHSWQICLDAKMNVVGVFELATGNETTCMMSPSSVARNALLSSACGVILAHNHPSGNSNPSADDIAVTKRVSEGLKLLDIQLCDHIVIGYNNYTSLREQGIF